MATEKQIAANRANAKRSTGPKTLAGKLRSSRNAYRHGLTCPSPFDPLQVDAFAQALVGGKADDHRLPAAAELAQAQLDLLRIRSVRTRMMEALLQSADVQGLHQRQALDRYERYARTKRRRAFQKL